MAIEVGKSYIFITDDSDMLDYNGDEAFVIRPLTEKEAGMFNVSNMYIASFTNGYKACVFEDELTA